MENDEETKICECYVTDAGWNVTAGESMLRIVAVIRNTVRITYHSKIAVGTTIVCFDGETEVSCDEIRDTSSEYITSFVKYICARDIILEHRDKLSRVSPSGGAIDIGHALTRSNMEIESVIFTSWMLSNSRMIKLLANSCLSFIHNFCDLFPIGEYRQESLSEIMSTVVNVVNFSTAMIARTLLLEHMSVNSEFTALRLDLLRLGTTERDNLDKRISLLEDRVDNIENTISTYLL